MNGKSLNNMKLLQFTQVAMAKYKYGSSDDIHKTIAQNRQDSQHRCHKTIHIMESRSLSTQHESFRVQYVWFKNRI